MTDDAVLTAGFFAVFLCRGPQRGRRPAIGHLAKARTRGLKCQLFLALFPNRPSSSRFPEVRGKLARVPTALSAAILMRQKCDKNRTAMRWPTATSVLFVGNPYATQFCSSSGLPMHIRCSIQSLASIPFQFDDLRSLHQDIS